MHIYADLVTKKKKKERKTDELNDRFSCDAEYFFLQQRYSRANYFVISIYV